MGRGTALFGRKGQYTLSSLLATGGMSYIWLAKSERLGLSEVAVKIPKEEFAAKEKLNFEVDILQNIEHEHIVSFIDSGDNYSFSFLVEEYVKGENLELIAAGKPLDENDAKKYIVETLLALDYIHSRNIVHRDVKPKNLIVKEEKNVKLIDFGTSIYFNKSGLIEAVISPGGYTAPEQYFFMTSPQSDIWSTGATLFFLLTGQHPMICLPNYPSIRPPTLPDARRFNPDISEEVSKVIMKALAWDPSERYFSAREMMDALEQHVEPEGRITEVPVLEVMGKEIRIDAPVLRFGRIHEDRGTTTSISEEFKRESGERVKVMRSGDVIEVYVFDPYNWISRRHFEIFEKGNKWFIKDLGSLNRTAVRTRGTLREIWVKNKVEGPPVELGEKAIIHIAYGASLNSPPYVSATFRRGKS